MDGSLVGSLDCAGVSSEGDGLSGTTFEFVCGWSVTNGELSGSATGLEPSGLTLNSNPEGAGESDTLLSKGAVLYEGAGVSDD